MTAQLPAQKLTAEVLLHWLQAGKRSVGAPSQLLPAPEPAAAAGSMSLLVVLLVVWIYTLRLKLTEQPVRVDLGQPANEC